MLPNTQVVRAISHTLKDKNERAYSPDTTPATAWGDDSLLPHNDTRERRLLVTLLLISVALPQCSAPSQLFVPPLSSTPWIRRASTGITSFTARSSTLQRRSVLSIVHMLPFQQNSSMQRPSTRAGKLYALRRGQYTGMNGAYQT
jgi:hypothetical protein